MKHKKSLLAIALLLFNVVTLFAQKENDPLLRYPSVSPDGKKIAFSYQGDIWVSGLKGETPKRLTIHEAYEFNPVWSPDGKLIAFSSDRMGNNDVYVIPADGGMSERLTFHSANDVVSDWGKDNIIYFTTARSYKQIEWDDEIYGVPAKGGTPVRKSDALGDMPVVSPNGNLMAIVKGSCGIEREAYRGPANKDIWIHNTKNDKFHKITTDAGNDFMPVFADDKTLYYISGASGRYNVHKLTLKESGEAAGKAEQVTKFTEHGIFHFDLSKEGNVLVAESHGNLYKQSLKGGGADKIDINVLTDYRFDPIEHKTFTRSMDAYKVSPNGKFVAFVIRGEVFVKEVDKEKKRTVNLSKHPYRDQDVSWVNDSVLVFSSDRNGQFDLFLVKSGDTKKVDLFKSLKHSTVQLTTTPEDEVNPVVSPDGKKIAFQRGRGQLLIADISADGKIKNEKILLNGWAAPNGVVWSPDSRYLAYSLSDLNFNSEVFIHPVDNSIKPVNVSMHPRSDSNPLWSLDGSKLSFVSQRNNGDADVWFVWLTKEEWEKTKEDREEGYYFADEETQEGEKTGKENTDKKKKKEVKPVKIDFDNIHDRLQQITAFPGNESNVAISQDGETFFYTTQSPTQKGYDLYSVKFDGSDLKQITKDGQSPYSLHLNTPTNSLFFMKKGGSLVKYDLKAAKEDALPFMAALQIDHTKEREQIFEEAWRALNVGFYDPQFHGKDWVKLKADYKQLALNASTDTDFREAFNRLLGQLNASHMGLRGGADRANTQHEFTGMLGVEVEPTEKGMLVKDVIRNSPADKSKSKLNIGDYIIAVNGEPVSIGQNFYGMFANTAQSQVLLEVQDKDGKKRELVIRPDRSLSKEKYEEWIQEQKALVDRYSNGRLGYIHIQGMNMPSFERFERELTASGQGKEGVVIDVRYNGGGWTTDYLMAVLTVKQHAYTIPRGAVESLNEHKQFSQYYPYGERLPLASWTKPSVAICNSSSYSNAEIFSHAYKNLKVGTLIGTPTFGAVISTGAHGLIDGSYVRMPFRAWYVKATGENMENGPAVPDIIVDNDPGEKAKGEDTQLKVAVEQLLKEIDGGKKK